MSKLLVRKNGRRRLIIFCGEVSELTQELHDRAMEDPAFEKAIMTAATAISFTNKSKQIGEHMIEMVLYPETR